VREGIARYIRYKSGRYFTQGEESVEVPEGVLVEKAESAFLEFESADRSTVTLVNKQIIDKVLLKI
jgi:hypothetical protein